MLLAVNAHQQSIHLRPRLLYACVADFDNVETLQLVTHGLQRFVYYEVNPMTRARQFFGAIGWIVFVYFMAGLAAFGSADAPQIYAEFTLASWAPPATVFGPVWTLLYTMMAFSAWLIWRDHGFASAQNWFLLFFVQLMTNVFWSWFFFAWLSGFYAFVNILTLIVLLSVTIVLAWRFNRLASMLLVPYFLWVAFATALNFSVWQLNPAMLG